MSKASPAITNFNSGEFTPLLEGRVDFERYQNGCVVMENFIPTVQGPAVRRGGTRYVASVKTAAKKVWLQAFEFSETQAYVLEFGDTYVRFYTQNGQLVSGGSPVEVATPYTLAQLFNADGTCRLRFAQSGDFLYIVHPSHAPRILKRTSATTFTLETFVPKAGPFKDVDPDSAITVSSSGETGTVTLTASAAIFQSGHVGTLFYIEAPSAVSEQQWEAGKRLAGPGDNVFGLLRRSDSKNYRCVTNYTVPGGGVEARTGTVKPTHSRGIVADGDGEAVVSGSTMFANRAGVDWEFLHAGYGWVLINSIGGGGTTASCTVVSRLPASLVITGAGAVKTITAVADASGKIRITSSAHGIANLASVTVSITYDYSRPDPDPLNPPITGTDTFTSTTIVNVVDASTLDLDLDYSLLDGITAFVSGSVQSIALTGAASNRWAHAAWSNVEGWPSAVAFFRERLFFARGQRVWSSVSAAFDDFSRRNDAGEVTADMGIALEVASGEINEIQWLHPDRDLIAGTAGGEFSIGELTNGDALGPGNVRVLLQSRFGTRAVPPVSSGNATLFLMRAGTKVREIAYDFTSDAYKSSDATTLSEHITTGGLIDMDFALEPYSVVWSVRADGMLVGFTWNNEEQVKGWHRHPIGGNGAVESLAVIPRPDGTGDQVWMVVRRTINGGTVRYVEYMENPLPTAGLQADAFYVDAGLTYSGAAATTISGLTHLIGATVDILTNGAPHPQRVVSNSGTITLQAPATKVQVGLPCPPRLQTMRIEAGAADGTAQGKTKRMHKVTFRFLRTAGAKVGPNASNLQTLEFRTPANAMDAPPPLFSGDKLVAWPGGYEIDNRIEVTHDQPTPVNLVAIYAQIVTQDAR